VDIPGRGPTAFFSILEPHTKIPPHTGVTNTRVTVHLPLIVPPGCAFRVGGETREWKVGTAWVFDDTIEHEAWNDSDAPRAILIFDVWNPELTVLECDLVRETTIALSQYHEVEGAVPGVTI
jgi:aspartate beta-hydroxylase